MDREWFDKEYYSAQKKVYRMRKFTGVPASGTSMDDVDLESFFTDDPLIGFPFRGEVLAKIEDTGLPMDQSDVCRIFWDIINEKAKDFPEEVQMQMQERISSLFLQMIWFKVFRRKEFYAAVFSEDFHFDACLSLLTGSRATLEQELEYLKRTARPEAEVKMEDGSSWDLYQARCIEQALECRASGIEFLPIDINKSDPFLYLPVEDGILLPFNSDYCLDLCAVEQLLEYRKEKTITSEEDLTGFVSEETLDLMSAYGIFDSLKEPDTRAFHTLGKAIEQYSAREGYLRWAYRRKAGAAEEEPAANEPSAEPVIIPGGYKNGKLYALCGRPAMGKTAYLLSLALEAARKGIRVWYLSTEDSLDRLADRLFYLAADIPDRWGSQGHYDEDFFEGVRKEIPTLPLYLCSGIRGLEQIEETIRKEVHGGLVIIDYLDLITWNGQCSVAHTGDRQREELREIARRLKWLAEEKDVPVIAAASVNRTLESRKDKRPCPGDFPALRGCEDLFDGISALYRAAYYDPKEDPKKAERIILKDSEAVPGAIPLDYDPERVRMRVET